MSWSVESLRLWKKGGWTLGISRLSFTRQLSSANPSFFKCLFKYIQTKPLEIISCILDILTKLIFCGIHWTGFPRQLPVNNHKPRSKPTHSSRLEHCCLSGIWMLRHLRSQKSKYQYKDHLVGYSQAAGEIKATFSTKSVILLGALASLGLGPASQ